MDQTERHERPSTPQSAVLIMGVTGSGKSTFISLLANESVRVGHDLTSCTSTVQGYTASIDGTSVLLLDTPGFDDTERTDVEILSEIALYLNTLYFSPVQLVGIIYIHRITDTRMSGSSLKSLRMFEGICGLGASENIIFLTTMWSKLGPNGQAVGEERMRELRKTFLIGMVRRGAQVRSHDGTDKSANEILREIIRSNQPVVLNIQREMGDEGLPLEHTTVGRILQHDLVKQQADHDSELKEIEQQLQEAEQSNDQSTVAMLNEDGQRHRQQLRQLADLRQQLNVSIEQLGSQRDPNYGARLQEARAMAAMDENENEDLRRQIRKTKKRREEVSDHRDIERDDFKEKEYAIAFEGYKRSEKLDRAERRKLQKKREQSQDTFLELMAGWFFPHPTVVIERQWV